MTIPRRPRGGPAARITEDTKAEVIRLIENGATVTAAADAVGYTDRTIHREAQRDRAFWDALSNAIATGAEKRRKPRKAAL